MDNKIKHTMSNVDIAIAKSFYGLGAITAKNLDPDMPTDLWQKLIDFQFEKLLKNLK